MDAVRENYDRMARQHRNTSQSDLLAADNIDLRIFNNFVKSCWLDVAARCIAPLPLRVLDIACGRGQDHAKIRFAARAAGVNIQSYIGVDLSEEDVTSARRSAAKQFVGTPDVQVVKGDMCAGGLDFVDDASINLVTCQLALHYACDSRDRIAAVLSSVDRVAGVGAIVLLSFVDGRAIVRRGRDAAADIHSTADPVEVARRYYNLRVPRACLTARLESPWGHSYVFDMPGAVEAVPESLCHEGAVASLLKQFIVLQSSGFHDTGRELMRRPRYTRIADMMHVSGADEDVIDGASLYRIVAFARPSRGGDPRRKWQFTAAC